MTLQVVLLLFRCETVKVNVLILILIISVPDVLLPASHIIVYKKSSLFMRNIHNFLTMSREQCRVTRVAHHFSQLFGIYPIKPEFIIVIVFIIIDITSGCIPTLDWSLLLVLNTYESIVFNFFIFINEDVVLMVSTGSRSPKGLPGCTCIPTLLCIG
jgi:hypothetical protein